MKKLLGFTAAVLSLAAAALASAQTYPTKPVKLVVAYAAGGGVDTVARALAQELSGGLGQPVVVENRPGANGAIGSQAVLQAPADGFVDAAQARLVVAGDQQLEPRHELEEVLAHEPGSDLVTASQGFQLALGPAAALFGLDGGHDARAAPGRAGWPRIQLHRHCHVLRHARPG